MIAELFDKLVSLILFFGPAALVLGVLIFIHELGHFLAARWVGIRVEVFSIGFGKRLFGIKRGDTDYRLSAIPFGGYVRMAGEELPGQGPSESGEVASDAETVSDTAATALADTTSVAESTLPPPSDPTLPGHRLQDKSVPQRILVAVAGAGMNLILAVVLTIGLAFFGIHIESYLVQPPIIAYVQPDSIARLADIQAGDRIRSVNQTPVDTWEDAQTQMALHVDQPMTVDLLRDQTPVTVTLTLEKETFFDFGGMSAPARVIVGSIRDGSPADRAGLNPGDHIVTIDGHPLANMYEMIDVISRADGKSMLFELQRENSTKQVHLTPEFIENTGRYMIGIGFDTDKVLRRYPLTESVKRGIELNVQMGRMMFTLFQRLLTGKESVKNMGGPVMIVDMAGKAAKSGTRDLIWLTALISLNLAILNLLPLPILDGGMVVFLLIEWIIRRPVGERIQLILQNIFFFLIISFALYITYIDILRTDFHSWLR
ncbi:RIP metalloprotease RseP [bacterium]|nr:RIP metalloprotease RseP [candidate division CSSED10-310 bacterium]